MKLKKIVSAIADYLLKMRKIKAIILFSGGLDSILAAKILQEQKIKLLGINFKSCFFNEGVVKTMAEKINLDLNFIDFFKEQMRLVKNPKYGYGKNMNPCIDCRILMLEKAKEIIKKKEFDFVVTGEVLGQRPMTQNKRIMKLVEGKSGLKNLILRPLSAKLLDLSIPEKNNWVNRNKLLNISGRSRKEQIKLAKKYNIKNYPAPAGGCLLTDPEFSNRLRKLIEICPKCQENDIELLKVGRHFFIKKTKIIIGRDEKENQKIKKLAQSGDNLIEMKDFTGPLTLVRKYGKGIISLKALDKAKDLTQYYSLKARNKNNIMFKINNK